MGLKSNGIIIFNTISGGIRECCIKKTGMPQGDPFSMMFTALIMRPWILEMRRLGAKGRVLADDILTKAEGDDHCHVFTRAFEETHMYLHMMGAKLAPPKSYIFSTASAARRKLAKYLWPQLGTVIEVVHHTRDLGAHINTTKNDLSVVYKA